METNHEERNNETLDESVLYPQEVVTMMTPNSSGGGRRSVHSSAVDLDEEDTESQPSEEDEFIFSVVQGRIAHAVEEEVWNTFNNIYDEEFGSKLTSQEEEKKEPSLQQISAKVRPLHVVDDLDRSSSSSESSEDFLFDILRQRAAENEQQIGESSAECFNLVKKKVFDDDNEREKPTKEKNMKEVAGDRGTTTPCSSIAKEEETVAVQSKGMFETMPNTPAPLVGDVAGIARTVSLPGAFHSRPSINGSTLQPQETALISDSVCDDYYQEDSATLATDAVSIIGGAELVTPGEELVVVDPEGGYALQQHHQQEEDQGQQQEEVSELFEATLMTDSDTQRTSSHSKYNKWCYFGILLLITAIGILIILCMVFITPSSHDDDAIQSSSSSNHTLMANGNSMYYYQYPPFSEDLTENAKRQIMEVIGSPLSGQ